MILLMGLAGTGKKTIADAMIKQENRFKLAHHHAWIDPILKLLGDDESIWWSLDEKGWLAVNQACDVILNKIADVCPKESNFIITYEMLANNPYHQDFFDKVCAVAKKRDATLIPVRLTCQLDELVNRVKDNQRAAYYKTRDINLIKKRFKEEQVFSSNSPQEYTLDTTTNLMPEDSARMIIQWVRGIQSTSFS